ncbi:IS5 family transposase, partial [Gluconobacter sp. DsW_056]
MDETIGATDAEWALTGSLLPSETGRGCRPAGDNRQFFDGMIWMARTGAQWRHLPPCYGKWNSVFRRYRRWVEQGVFDALLETLAELVGRDRSADMIDSTVVRAHHCAAGIKKALARPRRSDDRAAASRPNSTPVVTRAVSRSPSASRSGHAHDQRGFGPLFQAIGGRLDRLLADRGYDADQTRADIA